MFRQYYDYATEMSDGLTMLVVGVGVLVARVVGLPATIINMCVGGVFIVAGLIVMQGRRIQAKDKSRGESFVRWGFWLFSLCAGAFVAHNTLGAPPS
jgi:FtsH-binding integral membrane protein